jgi:hypothetical protein
LGERNEAVAALVVSEAIKLRYPDLANTMQWRYKAALAVRY